MQTDETIKQFLEGTDPAQVIEVLYSEVQTLLANDSEWFSGGRSNSIVKTLQQLIAMIKGIDKHEELREILINSGNAEYGDILIDEICRLFDYPTTA